MSDLFDVFLDALLDSAKLLPFLLLTVFVMEYLEHRAADRFVLSIRKAGRFGPALGALLGCVPQCGFSAACAELFNGGLVSAGTLVAVFLSTSDEAVPVLLANPGGWQEVLRLLLVKLVVAMGAGFLLDLFWNRSSQDAAFAANAETHVCKSDSKFSHILLAAVRRTLEIFQYLFLFSLALGLLISLIGEEKLSALLLPGPFQPLIAALVGLIPNCASSVVITQLYLDQVIGAGPMMAGLLVNAGVGLVVLFRLNHDRRKNLEIVGVLYGFGVFWGILTELLGIIF